MPGSLAGVVRSSKHTQMVRRAWVAALRHLAEHPEELARLLRAATQLRMGVPLPAVRWLLGQRWMERWPKRIDVQPAPPGVRVAAVVDVLGSELDFAATLFVERIDWTSQHLLLGLRVGDVSARVQGRGASALAAVVNSGSFDWSRVGDLIARLPGRPDYVVEASGGRVVLDLMRHPAFSAPLLAELAERITPWLSISTLAGSEHHLSVQFRVLRSGWRAALAALPRPRGRGPRRS